MTNTTPTTPTDAQAAVMKQYREWRTAETQGWGTDRAVGVMISTDLLDDLESHIDAQQQRIAELERELGYYADPTNYTDDGAVWTPCIVGTDEEGDIYSDVPDRGDRARRALRDAKEAE